MSRIKEIEDYLMSITYSKEEIKTLVKNPILLASAITMCAHSGQKRTNGEAYYHHPQKVYESLREFIGANQDGFNINEEWLEKHMFPLKGTQEVALLHDVAEDTSFTVSDLKAIYEECGMLDYFSKYIEEPLILITHNKEDAYDEYLEKVLSNRTSSIVKFLDLHDNLNYLSLIEFNQGELERCERYLKYAKKINDKHHFLENGHCYRDLFRKKPNK